MLRLGFRVMLGLDVSTGGNGARSGDFRGGGGAGGNAGGGANVLHSLQPAQGDIELRRRLRFSWLEVYRPLGRHSTLSRPEGVVIVYSTRR